MIEVKLKDLQVGQKYYLHKVKDDDTHAPISLKYEGVCTIDYTYSDWYEFWFDNVKGINTKDPENGIDICLDDAGWGIYKIYLCEKDKIIERVTVNSLCKKITGDPSFQFY
jgi:hypothetical protein